MSEELKIREYVTRKLAAGTSPAVLVAELVRYRIPYPQARALVQEVAGLPWDNGPPPASQVEPVGIEAGMTRDDLVDFAKIQLSYHDTTTVHQLLLGYGCSDEEAHDILAATGMAAGAVREPPRPKSTGLESTYIRVPVVPANAKGWLSGAQRKELRRELRHRIWSMVVLFFVGVGGGFLFASAIGAYVNGIIIIPLNLAALLWLTGGPAFCAVAIIGIVVLLFDVARHVEDMFPGRIRIARAYLHSPFVTKTGSTVSCRLYMGRKQFRVWRPELYNMVGQWGLERPYQVYYSPRVRWIWHLELKEE